MWWLPATEGGESVVPEEVRQVWGRPHLIQVAVLKEDWRYGSPFSSPPYTVLLWKKWPQR
jgi:hypothetical protein